MTGSPKELTRLTWTLSFKQVMRTAALKYRALPNIRCTMRWISARASVAPIRPPITALHRATTACAPYTDWTHDDIAQIYAQPLMELVFAAASLHRRFHNPSSIQLCTLMNIKTGGCSEDCAYCAQSSRYTTGVKSKKISSVEEVLKAARIAKENGSTRFCMGAAWRDMRGRKTNLRNIKEMVRGVREIGLETCVTLGMIDDEQARELKEAGLTAYNHNVDTSREFYPKVITSRTYDERLKTLENVRGAGLNVCSGGILGMGEERNDHIGMLHTLATMHEHPESFPINILVPVAGTPLGDSLPERPGIDTTVRMIATSRLVLPCTIIRLAAGRISFTEAEQMLCFIAGANAIFTGEKMLTTPCSSWDEDKAMMSRWGLRAMLPDELENLRASRTSSQRETEVKVQVEMEPVNKTTQKVEDARQ